MPRELDKEWIPDDALAALQMERAVNSESPDVMARRLLNENLPVAVASLGWLAVNSSNETIRLKAANIIIERNLGRVAPAVTSGGVDWESLVFGEVKKD